MTSRKERSYKWSPCGSNKNQQGLCWNFHKDDDRLPLLDIAAIGAGSRGWKLDQRRRVLALSLSICRELFWVLSSTSINGSLNFNDLLNYWGVHGKSNVQSSLGRKFEFGTLAAENYHLSSIVCAGLCLLQR